MDLLQINGIKIYIIESLKDCDIRTGENLKDNLRQIWYDQGLLSDFYCQYIPVENENEFVCSLSSIEKEVNEINKLPIIQFECHGCTNKLGIVLRSNDLIKWKFLFDLLRPINIASSNLLLVNLSMCNGDGVIGYIDPTKRAPFRAVTCSSKEVFPDFLENVWQRFYGDLVKSFREEYGLSKNSMDSGVLYFSQELIFDSYFDLANKDPELFDTFVKKELYNLYLKEGPLDIDIDCFRKYVANQQTAIKEKYRSQFCFDELKHIHKEIYKKMKQKEDS